MAAEADKFGAALGAVRQAIRDHVVAPGEALHVESLARRLRMSATPIREALAYLSGAGEAERQNRGYRVRRLEPSDIRELYQLHAAYVRMLLEEPFENSAVQAPVSDTDPGRSDYPTRVGGLWLSLGSPTRPRLHRVLQQVTDQLALVRASEPSVLSDVEGELETLWAHMRTHTVAGWGELIDDYHSRRIADATALSAAVYWPSNARKI